MKALKSTGHVVVTIKEPFRNYRSGDTVRFSPQDAQKYLDGGFVSEAKLREGAETVTIKAQEPALVSGKILPRDLPAIPEDWEQMHNLQKLKLAEQIAGQPVKKVAEADSVIRDELKRRTAE